MSDVDSSLPPAPPPGPPPAPPPPPIFDPLQPPSGPVRQPWPTWTQAIVIFIGSFVLAVSSCFGMILSFDMGDYKEYEGVAMGTASIVFLISLFGLLVGAVMFLLRLVRALTNSSGTRPTPGSKP